MPITHSPLATSRLPMSTRTWVRFRTTPIPVHVSVVPKVIYSNRLAAAFSFHRTVLPVKCPATPEVQRECLSECVRHLVFGNDTTMFSDDSETAPHSGSDSGYSSAPDPSHHLHASLIEDDLDSSFINDSCDDSDSSGFFETPLTHRAVTHKAPKKHNFITKGLKQIGKKIKQSRIGECMSTLAVM